MPGILDKFGKASIPTDVAIATTVKTTRLPGVFVLEAFDLSKYAQDTPVFVVTYKKTTDPVTGVVSITQLRSWKALVNPGANTLTNLTIQPGYTDDIGNAVGDFIECIPTTAWVNSLIDGIRTSLNDDGTLKTSAVQSALGIVNNPSVGWNVLAQALTYVANNGNGEYTGTFNGDVTSILQPGMKLLVPRTNTPPTQMMSFQSASSQYAAKAAPTAHTFTGTFTIEAMVYLNGYTNAEQTIMSRYDGSNGYGLRITANGLAHIFYAAAGAITDISTYIAIPLRRMTHIAAVTNPTTKVVTFYINGRVVPSQNIATAAASMAQGTGSFALGLLPSTASQYLNGYLGEARLWSVGRTQNEIQTNMNIALTGGEANLVGLWQGNGNFNDKTTNANHLTASGGAIATQLMAAGDTAYANATEYFFVTKVGAFSGGVTPVTLYGGIDGRMPSNGVGTIQYSNVKSPFGFPTNETRWYLEQQVTTQSGVTPGNQTSWTNLQSFGIDAPTGEWRVAVSGTGVSTAGIAAGIYPSMAMILSTTTNSNSRVGTDWGLLLGGNNSGQVTIPFYRETYLSNPSAMTPYYLLERDSTGNANGAVYVGSGGLENPTMIRLKPAYI